MALVSLCSKSSSPNHYVAMNRTASMVVKYVFRRVKGTVTEAGE